MVKSNKAELRKISNGVNPLDRRILNRLQKDIPFVSKPWESVARELYIEEGLLLKRIASLKEKGIIRRISASFSSRKVNFASTLVGVRTVPGRIRKVVEEINSYPEVTHNYRRNGKYNIWFTLVARDRKRIACIISRLKENRGIELISEFPAIKLFKINVMFPV